MAAYSWHSFASLAPLNTTRSHTPCEALAVNLRQPLRRDNIWLPLNFRSPSIPPFPTPASAYSDTYAGKPAPSLALPLITDLARPRGRSRKNVRVENVCETPFLSFLDFVNK